MSRPIVIVAAVAENGVIGRGDGLPWHISGDLKHFRAITWGRPIIMGRRTFASIGRPLPGRISVVLTRDPAFTVPEGVRVVRSLDEALAAAEAAAELLGAVELAVIGGADIYAQALPRATRLHLTRVHCAPDGDVRFPAIDFSTWRETARDGPHRTEKDDFAYSFVEYARN